MITSRLDDGVVLGCPGYLRHMLVILDESVGDVC